MFERPGKQGLIRNKAGGTASSPPPAFCQDAQEAAPGTTPTQPLTWANHCKSLSPMATWGHRLADLTPRSM